MGRIARCGEAVPVKARRKGAEGGPPLAGLGLDDELREGAEAIDFDEFGYRLGNKDYPEEKVRQYVEFVEGTKGIPDEASIVGAMRPAAVVRATVALATAGRLSLLRLNGT